MEQLSLSFGQSEDALKRRFEKATGREVILTITDNISSMLTVKAKGETLSVRLNRIFLGAALDVIDEVAQFLKKGRGKTPLINSFIREKRGCLREKAARRVNAKPSGKHYDLTGIYESVNMEYFKNMVTASITWGTKSPRYAVRRRTLGSFSSHSNTIRINPALDNTRVPRYFIEFIVYHEMLHAKMGVEKTSNGRRSVHPRKFKERERQFKEYERAMAWEKKNRV